MTIFKGILIIVGAILLLKKPQKDQYPNFQYASPHFEWDELIVSASAPAIAAKYRDMYPEGDWPTVLDLSIWPKATDGRLTKLKTMVYPELLNQPISITMVNHLKNIVEPLREHLGNIPLEVISGWRPAELNSAVGGARLSGHMLGVATDFRVEYATKKKARAWAIERQRTHGDIGFFESYSWGFHIASVRGFNDGIIDGIKYKQIVDPAST